MPVLLDVRLDQREINNALSLFDKRNADRVFANALNDTARQAQTEAARRIAKEGGFKVGVVKKALTVHRAKPGDTQAVVTATGSALTLLKASRTAPVQTKRGVRAKVWGKSKIYQGTFLARMPGGHVGIFRRKTYSRLPIAELFGPSIPRLMVQAKIRGALDDIVPQRLRTNLARQVDRRLRMLAGKAG